VDAGEEEEVAVFEEGIKGEKGVSHPPTKTVAPPPNYPSSYTRG